MAKENQPGKAIYKLVVSHFEKGEQLKP